MTMKYYEFKGVIKLIQPFTVNLPNTSQFPTDSNGNPLMPSHSLRGWLRFASYRSLLEVMKDKGILFSIHEHYLLAKGIDTGDLVQVERATSIGSNVNVRQVNPVMDLYGRWGLASALGVGSAIAPIASLIKAPNSSRGHIIDSFDDFERYVVEEDQQLLMDFMSQDAEVAPQIRELTNKIKLIQQDKRNAPNIELKNDLNVKIQELQAKVDVIKDSKSGHREIVRRTDYGLDIIDSNTDAHQVMKLTGNHIGSLQYLLWTISKLPLFRVGGGRAFNYGVVEPLWKITEHSFAHPEGKAVGEVGWFNGKLVFSLNNDLNFDLRDFENNLTNKDIFDFKVFG